MIPQGKNLKKVVVMPTLYGTVCSFNIIKPRDTQLFLYVRADNLILLHLTEALVSALTKHFVLDQLNGTWADAEVVSDWIMSNSKLTHVINKHFPKFHQATLKTARTKQSSSIHDSSRTYLKKLGFAPPGQLLSLKQNDIYHQNNRLSKLNAKDRKILAHLILNHTITTDQVADMIFESDDDYSLYAISKRIQRLRDKLEQNGISGSIIQTIRGTGYQVRG